MSNFIRPGNPALFNVIQILNVLFGVSAIVLVALGIWLWRQFNAFNMIEIVFITMGVFEFILALFVFTAKKSVIKYSHINKDCVVICFSW